MIKRMKKHIYQVNINQNKADVAILMSDKKYLGQKVLVGIRMVLNNTESHNSLEIYNNSNSLVSN